MSMLRFSVLAKIKWELALQHATDHLNGSEIACLLIRHPEDELLIEDLAVIAQENSGSTVDFKDAALAEYFDAEDHDPTIHRVGWIHSHPKGMGSHPSGTDQATFDAHFAAQPYAFMVIHSDKDGTVAHMRVNFNGGDRSLTHTAPVSIDWDTTDSVEGFTSASWKESLAACCEKKTYGGSARTNGNESNLYTGWTPPARGPSFIPQGGFDPTNWRAPLTDNEAREFCQSWNDADEELNPCYVALLLEWYDKLPSGAQDTINGHLQRNFSHLYIGAHGHVPSRMCKNWLPSYRLYTSDSFSAVTPDTQNQTMTTLGGDIVCALIDDTLNPTGTISDEPKRAQPIQPSDPSLWPRRSS